MPEQDESSDVNAPDEDDAPDDDTARRRFVEDLVIRGEVVPAGPEPLPPGVTHESVEDGDGGSSTIRRRRFSLAPGGACDADRGARSDGPAVRGEESGGA